MKSKKLIEVPNEHLARGPDETWERRPGRLLFRMTLESAGPIESDAASLAKSNPRLPVQKQQHLERCLAAFFQAAQTLRDYLTIPLGDIPVQVDSPEIRNLWHAYLIRGRELLDAVGSTIHLCFGLNQGTKGLDRKKLVSWRIMIEQAARKVGGLERLSAIFDDHTAFIEEFVDLRNRDKTKNDTLLEPPWISEKGIPTGGLICNPKTGQSRDFVGFFNESFERIVDFARRILKSEPAPR